MKKIFEYVPVTTAIILFLYICGGFYLIAFWGTFHIDIANHVGIAEIPKSFFIPFSLTVGVMMFSAFLAVYVAKSFPKNRRSNSTRRIMRYMIRNNRKISGGINLSIYLIFVISILAFFNDRLRYSEGFLSTAGTLLAVLMAVRVYLSKRIRRKTRGIIGGTFALCIITATPIYSLAIGFIEGANIYKNRQIKEIRPIKDNNAINMFPTTDSTRYKLVGFLGDKFIISSFDNKKVIILNQSAYDGMELVKVKK